MEISLLEIFDLITTELNTTQNKKLFKIFNHLSGRSLKPCRCASKVSMIKTYLSEYLKENNFINA